jgi:2-keto-3-deoxy-L-rhamnonate aldolase RhmA
MLSFSSAVRSKSPQPLLGTSLTITNVYAAQILARCGFDWVMIDMEHSPMSASDMTAIVHSTVAASQGTCIPLVRVPSHGVEWIKWALDSGASGIVIPMVNTRQECEDIVSRALYPPAGARSSGPFRTVFADLNPDTTPEKYKKETTKNLVVFPMIESAIAVENADDIMSVPGVDGVFIGPVDLRASLGLNGVFGTEEVYLKALQKLVSIGKRLGVYVGVLGFGEVLTRYTEMGFDYLLLPTDGELFAMGAKNILESSREFTHKRLS